MTRRNCRWTTLAALVALLLPATPDLIAADSSPTWVAPQKRTVTVTVQPDGITHATSASGGEHAVDSSHRLPAKPGDAFAIKLRAQVGIDMAALPELVCYAADGSEILTASTLARGNRYATTNWQTFDKIFPALPGTAAVGARIRWRGRGTVKLGALSLQPVKIDPYETGALIAQPHAKNRVDVVLESNFGIVNAERITPADVDGDGKWALVTVNLDRLTAPAQKGEDWRSNFEDNPNVILWSDGAVLKSDSVRTERAPDLSRALHYRAKVHPGPYIARASDPGRPVAISVDGRTWRRCDPGSEIEFGPLPMADGVFEFWMDACYVDAITAGPVYFDYVRLTPVVHAPDIDRLFAAAQRKPPLATRGGADEQRVPVVIDAPMFAGGRSWPVRCGLPIPAGDLWSAANVAVLDARGAKIPSQTRVTATWRDSSVRWLLIDFLGDLSATAPRHYTVVYGRAVKPGASPAAVRVERTGEGLQVDTGALRFLVPGSRFGFLQNVRAGDGRELQPEPVSSEIVETDGRVWRALELPVNTLGVEQTGLLHTTILAETKMAEPGKPASGFFHRARIHAYAGSPLVHVDYFVANTDSRPAKDVGGSMASKVAIRSFALHLPITGGMAGAQTEAGAAAANGARIQKDERTVIDVRDGERRESSAHAAGWVALSLAGGGTLHAGLAEFREQFPKAIRWQRDRLSIDLWAAEGGEFDWIEGVGKTHHLAFHYGSGQPADGALLANGPVLALASPEWYARSGAFGEIGPVAESGLPEVEQSLAAYIKNPVVDRVGLGFENYGDHSSSGYVKGAPLWDNNEYDLPAACMVHFARTGDRAALRLGLASALHYVDVDMTHYSSQHPEWVGAQHTHSHGLFGHHTAQGPDFGHAGYTQGLLLYTYLTGNPEGLAGARGIADWCLRRLGVHTGGMERVLGHPLMTLNDLYEATWDEKYLRGSAHLVDQAFKWEHPVRGGFLSSITESPAYYSGCPFNNGLVSAGLLKFNQWARLPEIDAMLERFARWTMTDCWVAPLALASKGGSPNKGGSAQHISTHSRMMAHVYERTQDPFYLVVPARLASAGFSPKAKPIPGTRSVGMVYNYLPWLISALRQHGDPAPEPELEIALQGDPSGFAPGETRRIGFTVKNSGRAPVDGLNASLHSRLDVAVALAKPLPARLAPGESAECWYDVRAPAQVNLSCNYNAIAFAHWSALYRRSGKAHYAHVPVKLVIKSPGGAEARTE